MRPSTTAEFPVASRRYARTAGVYLAVGLFIGAFSWVRPEWLSVWFGVYTEGVRWFLTGVGLFLVVPAAARLRFAREGAVRLTGEHAVLPPSRLGLVPAKVPYGGMRLVLLQRGAADARLVISTRVRVYTLRADHVGGVATLTELYQGILLRMGREAVMRNEMGLAAARRMMERPARVTTALLFGLAFVYLWQMQSGGDHVGHELAALLQMGALFPPLVWEGEWYRLVSATVLHGNLLHIFFNGFALKELGGLVERLIGRERYLLVYVFSALAGSAASVLAGRAVPSVGASGAVFGILGALFAAQILRGRAIPPGARQSITWWSCVLAFYFVVLPLLVTQVDHLAHLGGFVAGAVVLGVTILLDPYTLAPTVPRPWGIRVGAMLAAAVFLAALLVGFRAAKETPWDQARLLEAFAPHAEIDLRNELAWYIVTDPEASRRELRAARKVAQENVDRLSGSDTVFERAAQRQRQLAEKRDTLATAHYRLGAFDEATRLQYEVLTDAFASRGDEANDGLPPALEAAMLDASKSARSFYVGQLVRFARARLRGREAPEPGVEGVTVKETGQGLTIRGVSQEGLLVGSVSADGIRYGGVLIALRGSPDENGQHKVPLEGELPAATEIVPLTILPLLDASWLAGARYWPKDEGLLGLP